MSGNAAGRAPRGGGGVDFFPTPAWCVRALLDACPLPGGTWLEPAVGSAAIVRTVERGNAQATRRWLACDVRDVRGLPYIEPADLRIGDFLDGATLAGLPAPDVIVTNPPYSHALQFAARCVELAAGRAWVALLLRLGFLESAARAPFLRRHPPDLYPLARRPAFNGGSSTDSAAYGWFVWAPDSALRRRGAGILFPPIGAADTRGQEAMPW